MGRPALSKNAFHRTMLSGCQFVALMIDAGAVKECSVPPGARCVNDTILRGFSELGTISLTFAADWCVHVW